MGLRPVRLLAVTALSISFAAVLDAAPQLRLANSAVGPVLIAPGANGPGQIIEAYNIGDGALSLSVSSSAAWLAASVGSPRSCTSRSGSCIPLQLALNTASLPSGAATGIVTVKDPNAIDAPQTITVTVQMASGVDLYVAPNGSRDFPFATSQLVSGTTTTQDGNAWLSLALDGNGSLRFSYPYRIHLAPVAGMAQGTYNGSVTTSGSSLAGDDKTIPVTMRITTQPIAQVSPDHLEMRLAQGAPPGVAALTFSNLGQGTLTNSGVFAQTQGSWLTTSGGEWFNTGTTLLTFDPGSLAPGVYSGSVSIGTNAANGTLSVPVSFEVVAKGAPLIYYQGVVDNGTYGAGDALAPGDVTVAFGEQFSFSALTVAPLPPLPKQVGGATVLVNGVAAPMYYSSYGVLAFQMPVDAPIGVPALVQVQRDGLTSNTVAVNVVAHAPRLLFIGSTGYGAIVNARDGSLTMPSSYQVAPFVAHPASVGDTVTLYAIGMGATNPAVASGAPAPSAEPFARVTALPSVNFGGGIAGTTAIPSFAGLTPGYAGLYQVNVTIPDGVPKGIVNLSVAFSDAASNSVLIAIQ